MPLPQQYLPEGGPDTSDDWILREMGEISYVDQAIEDSKLIIDPKMWK